MPRARSFAVSTQLYHGRRLTRDHLHEVASAGFDAVELSALRTHIDYHHDSSIGDLQQWLAEARLSVASVHAPVAEHLGAGRSVALNLASPDAADRAHAVEEATRALQVARRLAFPVLVVHAGVVRTPRQAPGENNRDAARRSIETLAGAARPLGVAIAVELMQNELSKAASLAHFVEDVLDAGAASICLDLGHAHIAGDVLDAIETVSEHLVLVHAHDNRGRTDEHLAPFEGTIDWPGAMTTLQKVDRKSTRLNSSHVSESRMPSSA